MRMIKKCLAMLLAAVAVFTLLSCGETVDTQDTSASDPAVNKTEPSVAELFSEKA